MSEWVSFIDAQAMIEVRFPLAPSMFAAAVKAMKDGKIGTRGTLLRTQSPMDYVPTLNPGENYPGRIDDNGRVLDAGSRVIDTREVNVEDLRTWMAKFGSGPTMNPEPANQNSDEGKPARLGRPKGTGKQTTDGPYVEEMRELLDAKLANNRSDAAKKVIKRHAADLLPEPTTLQSSVVSRLSIAYKRKFGE